jgi:hypothetical protein
MPHAFVCGEDAQAQRCRLLFAVSGTGSAVKSREKRENESKKAGSLSLRAPASVKIYLVPRKGL